jgi:hypothetical protein
MAFHKLKKSIYHREHRVITKKVRQKNHVNSNYIYNVLLQLWVDFALRIQPTPLPLPGGDHVYSPLGRGEGVGFHLWLKGNSVISVNSVVKLPFLG